MLAAEWKGSPLAMGTHYAHSSFNLVPNTAAVVLIAALTVFVDVEMAGKIVLTLLVLALVLGLYRLLRRVDSDHPFRWVGFLLVFNFFLQAGFINYVLAVTIFPYALCAIMDTSVRQSRYVLAVFFWLLVLEFCHVMVWSAFIVVVSTMALLDKRIDKSTKIWLITVVTLSALPILPAILQESTSGVWELYGEVIGKFKAIGRQLFFFHRYLPVRAFLPFSFLNVGVFILLGYGAVVSARHARIGSPPLMRAAMILFLFVLLFPFGHVGDYFYIDVRWLLPAVIVFLASVSFKQTSRRSEMVFVLAALVVAVGCSYNFKKFNDVAKDAYAVILHEYRSPGSPLVISRGFEEEMDQEPAARVSGFLSPFRRLHYYAHMEVGRQEFLPLFQTASYRWKADEGTRRLRDVDSIVTYDFSRERTIGMLRTNLVSFSQMFDRVIIVGTPETHSKFSAVLSEQFEYGEDRGIVRVLFRRHE